MTENLLLKALLLFLVAFIGYMHSYWGSTMHNRPLIMATLVGLVLGDLKTGIMIGSILELAFLGAVPIGASNPPDMTVFVNPILINFSINPNRKLSSYIYD